MKLRKIIPLFASLLLLTACSVESNTPSKPSGGEGGQGGPSEPAQPETKTYMTTIGEGKLYIDINLSTPIEGFAIKYGDQTVTETKTIDMPAANTEFTVTGTLNNICFYRAVEDTGVINGGVSENVDEEVANNMLAKQLQGLTKLAKTAKCYICITDTVGGWSKTIPGVDTIITKYKPSL